MSEKKKAAPDAANIENGAESATRPSINASCFQHTTLPLWMQGDITIYSPALTSAEWCFAFPLRYSFQGNIYASRQPEN